MMYSSFIIYDLVNASDNIVNLNVKIGHGQAGNTIVKLDNKMLADENDSFSLDLGPCKKVVKKTANLFVTIQDINDASNKISLELKITGGKKNYESTIIDSDVPNHGDTASALITIVFI